MLTPAELDCAERAINRTLAAQDPPRFVCLHADRTQTRDPLTSFMRVECDYCTAWSVSTITGTAPPDLMPLLHILDAAG